MMTHKIEFTKIMIPQSVCYSRNL